jgi:hypothetical protein
MKKFAVVALVLALGAPAAFAAEQAAKPTAYILRVAMDAKLSASCPTGFSLAKDQPTSTLAKGRVQVFACAKD